MEFDCNIIHIENSIKTRIITYCRSPDIFGAQIFLFTWKLKHTHRNYTKCQIQLKQKQIAKK